MYKIVVFFVLAASALLAACGSSATPSSSGAASPITVPITMTEFKIDVPQTTFKVGVPYRFVVTNKGTINHDLAISPPMMAGMAGMSEEDAHKNALAVIDAADLPPGTTKTIDLTFSKPYSSSEMEFACHTAGHYEKEFQPAQFLADKGFLK